MKIKVKKRNGNIVDFDSNKIKIAIEKAMKETDIGVNKDDSAKISLEALVYFKDKEIVDIEEIQDFVEFSLMKYRPDVAKKYIIYRQERKNLREKGWDMNELQKDIYNKKYKYENESFEEFLDRVSGGNSYVKKAIKDKKFMPAGRILSGRGLNKKGRKITYSNCFIAGTPVLTKDGYKPIEEVVVGDKVVTHMNRYQEVNATMINPYNEKLYEISTYLSDEPVTCTENHQFLTYGSFWQAAKDLDTSGDFIKIGHLSDTYTSSTVSKILDLVVMDKKEIYGTCRYLEDYYDFLRKEHIFKNLDEFKEGYFKIDKNGDIYIKIKSINIIDLKKYGATINVYNISVEEDHSYVVDGLVVHNCYVLAKPEDSIESIFDTAKYLARTYSYGGGCGVNISNLRPCGAKVNNAAQTTTGSVSFMDLYSMVTGLIGMRGRRGALMLNMDVSHPDIESFIDVKNDLSKVVYANTSVNVDDDFMKAVKENKDYLLHFKVKATGEEITKTINARELFKKLALNNWNMAEPGILFQDRINSWHLMSAFDNFEFAGVNPCAEEPLPAWGSCNLASINLSNFVKYPFEEDAYFDFQEFKVMVKHGVQYLNEVLDENSELHPLEMQKEVSKNLRQIGLGLMGVADMFIKMGIKYGSPASIKLIEKIGKAMINEALKASAMLAKKDGPFPMYDEKKLLNSEFLKQNANNEVIELIKKYGIRNSQLLTMAPTGSISTLIGCSNGVEPIFQISYTRKTETLNDKDTYYKVYTQIVREYMDKNNIKNEEDLPDFIVTSKDLDYKDRILVQAAWQKTIDASISSTCNVPYEFTVEEVEDLYMFAWEQGLKGVTIYRDGCKRSGILISNNKKTAKEKIDELEEEIKTIANDSLKENPDVCPMCGGKMNHSGGCAECQDCGYSPCSV